MSEYPDVMVHWIKHSVVAIPDLIYVLIKVFHYVIYCRGLVNFIAEQSIIVLVGGCMKG